MKSTAKETSKQELCTLHSARASRFSVNFYTVPAQLRREMTKFLRVRFLGRIQKRICDLNSYGFFITTKTEDRKRIIYHDNGMSSRLRQEEKAQ